jgi:hypothetical protein
VKRYEFLNISAAINTLALTDLNLSTSDFVMTTF